MIKYNEPEFNVVMMTSEDVLTISSIEDIADQSWETGLNPDDQIGFIEI